MAYEAALGLSEIAVGALLAVPSFDPQATFARLSAEELREDPGDRLVALISRHLPALVHHRGPWRTSPPWSSWSCSSGDGCRVGHARLGSSAGLT